MSDSRPHAPTTIRGNTPAVRLLSPCPATNTQLELDDIQSGVLRPRPTPYAATYIAFRIDDRNAGRDLMRRVSEVVDFGCQSQQSAGRHVGQRRLNLSGSEGARRPAGIA